MTFIDSQGNEIPLVDGATVAWRVSGYAVIIRDGKYLMVESSSGKWVFPGGGVEDNEMIPGAIVRECLEETGYSVAVAEHQPLYVRESQFYHKRNQAYYHSVQLFHKGTLTTDEPDADAIAGHDIGRAVDWIDLRTVDLNQVHPTLHELVQMLTK